MKDMEMLLEDMPKFFDEPLADASLIPTMLVSKLAGEHVTTVLSGDGGDELFCGYKHYSAVDIAQHTDWLGRVLHMAGRIGRIEKMYPAGVRIVAGNRDERMKVQLPLRESIAILDRIIPVDGSAVDRYGFDELKYNEKNWVKRRMLLDMDTYLPGEVLAKVDRASMKYSLECRCPLMDYRIVEYSMRLGGDFLKYRNRGKRILRDITHEYLPEKLMDRPKMGFSIPLRKWIKSLLKDEITELCSESYLKNQGIFEPDYTSGILAEYMKNGCSEVAGDLTGICWNLYVFQRWYDYYVQREYL